MKDIIKKKPKKERVVVYIDSNLKKALKMEAVELDTSVSHVVSSLVENYLESTEGE